MNEESKWKNFKAVSTRRNDDAATSMQRYIGHAAACALIAGIIGFLFPYLGAFFFENLENENPTSVHKYFRGLVDNDSATRLLGRVSACAAIGAIIGLLINLKYELQLRRG